MTKYVVSEKFGTVYCKDVDEIAFYPMSNDGTFDTDEGGIVATWQDMDVAEKDRIIKLLA